jgi:hypothetical protein
MATFPAYAKLTFDGNPRQRESALNRTNMEAGPPKQLKVKSRVMVERPVVYNLDTLSDYNNFITFFQTTINFGADWFDWVDPVDGATKLARIKNGQISKEEPRRKVMDRWRVGFTIETWSNA